MVRLFEQSELQPTMVASIPLKRNWQTIVGNIPIIPKDITL